MSKIPLFLAWHNSKLRYALVTGRMGCSYLACASPETSKFCTPVLFAGNQPVQGNVSESNLISIVHKLDNAQ